MEHIKFETGDGHYVEIEISEADKSTFASIRRQTSFEEAEGERAFIERALSKLDTLGRHACYEVGLYPYHAPEFEKAQAAGRNCMRFVQALYRWGYLQYHIPAGEWSLHCTFLGGPDGSEWLAQLWPRHGFSDVEVIEDV